MSQSMKPLVASVLAAEFPGPNKVKLFAQNQGFFVKLRRDGNGMV